MNAVKFSPNRVWRVYQGGSGIDALRRAETQCDGSFPEDWIASTSKANNPQYPAENQGLSKIITADGSEQFFHEYLAADPVNTLGEAHFAKHGANAVLLMKILDAAERLPIQVHPTVPDAERYFNSKFGKTEAWYVVATREVNGETPYLLLGFNDKLDKETFLDEARHGDFPTGKEMLHKLTVKPGDCFIVPGGTPHAIGCGCTIIEVMEPSDLVVQPEFFCGKQRLSESERWSNADPEEALKSFIFANETEAELRKRCSPEPEAIDASLSRLIPYSLACYFEVQKLQCSTSYRFFNREKMHRAGVITAGDLQLKTADGILELHRGDAFFLPYALMECEFLGNGEIIFALPPRL
ncbi:hypothetical protein FYJ85_17305 [Victivallaceae bacterium BBE-744-WT-12]|uniref:Mannose-6-phosphate isomerase n=1 Tax=Victivallis lenta TaxID=2606640 RepID=A0A844G604_9BACT|nr:class I mannose-6-phosphate isomerase [Victivallis lenta]MST98796.1 hypothetical protein [Victivallis lenta]